MEKDTNKWKHLVYRPFSGTFCKTKGQKDKKTKKKIDRPTDRSPFNKQTQLFSFSIYFCPWTISAKMLEERKQEKAKAVADQPFTDHSLSNTAFIHAFKNIVRAAFPQMGGGNENKTSTMAEEKVV